MPLRICLLRHAKSSWDSPGMDDFKRPLNPRGLRDAPRMGKLLRDKGINPSLVLSSDAKRAKNTAEMVLQAMDTSPANLQLLHALYLAPARTYLKLAAEHGGRHRTIILVGHNPGITDLVNQISDTRIDNMPTCGFAAIDFGVSDWSQLGRERGRLTEFLYPRKHLRN